MGAAPSREILRNAPFYPKYIGSYRVLSLIPITAEFFPSPDSPLFGQLYDARCDPYVRYYLRCEKNTDIRLDVIPPVDFTREEYYDRCMGFLKTYELCETNSELHEKYKNETSPENFLRPVPCAVAFLYHEQRQNAEGCVMLGERFVKVVGAVACELRQTNCESEPAVLDLTIFLRRSAGDHNMVRAMLFASWLFQTQCIDDCGLTCVPMLPISFRGLKTNIPFLCFLRDMRSRVEILHGNTKEHSMWVDGAFICGLITADHAADLCEAFAQQYQMLVESKSRSKVDVRPLPVSGRTLGSSSWSDLSSSVDTDDKSSTCQSTTSSRFHKQFFTLVGLIEKDNFFIPAGKHTSNEVYLVCVDAVVHVGQMMENNLVNIENTDEVISNSLSIKVKRGDILRFFPETTEPLWPENLSPGSSFKGIMKGDMATTTELDDDSEIGLLEHDGTWQVDPCAHLENVLLSFVHDECKTTREAQPDDPHWLRDTETGEPVSDGGFRIWCFERNGVKYAYGTLPRFANLHRRQQEARRNASRAPMMTENGITGTTEDGEKLWRKGGGGGACSTSSRKKSSNKNSSTQQKERDTGGGSNNNNKETGKELLPTGQRFPFLMKSDMSPSPVIPFCSPVAPLTPLQQPCYTETRPLMVVPPMMVYSSLPSGMASSPSRESSRSLEDVCSRTSSTMYTALDSPLPRMPIVQPMPMPVMSPPQYVPCPQSLPTSMPSAMPTAYYSVDPVIAHSATQPLRPVSYMPLQMPQQLPGNPVFIIRQ